MAILITLRHGESFKNIKNIDGGKGESLTELGKKQVQQTSTKIYDFLHKQNLSKVRIIKSCDRAQVSETADILSSMIGVPVEKEPRYVPIRLGVISGMSRDKQLQLYPTAVKEMDEWNAGIRDILDVHVDGMQDPREHVNRIIDLLKTFKNDEVVILIGTRSDISAIKNIELGNHPAIKDTFRFFPSGYAEATIVHMQVQSGKLIFNKGKDSDYDNVK